MKNLNDLQKDLETVNDFIKMPNPVIMLDVIKQMSWEYKTPFRVDRKCKDCIMDTLFMLRTRIQELILDQDSRKYLLKPGVNVVFKGIQVNNDIITDELAKKLIDDGFPKGLFYSL